MIKLIKSYLVVQIKQVDMYVYTGGRDCLATRNGTKIAYMGLRLHHNVQCLWQVNVLMCVISPNGSKVLETDCISPNGLNSEESFQTIWVWPKLNPSCI